MGRYNFKPPLPLRLYHLCGTLLLRRLHQMIKQGDNVLVHCRGGLGRSGTIAALLLIEFGLLNGLAIAQVRIARPGAIDIAEQEEYVRLYVALGQPS